MSARAQAFWSRKGWLNVLLLPLAMLFWLAAWLRRRLYQAGLLASAHPGVPVIVVGNLTAGGSGKTPFVIWLVKWLRAQGYRPGVVSRGYGRASTGVQVLNARCTANEVGDEPLLIHQLTGVPVVVGERRLEACRSLLAHHPEVNVLVSDDGLQHHAMQRDLELVLVDVVAGFGNGWLLPAGPLREPMARLKDADALIVGGAVESQSKPCIPDVALRQFSVARVPGRFRNLQHPAHTVDVSDFVGKPLEAVAGIARPQDFFTALEEAGLHPTCRGFPDHHRYTPAELDASACIVMTEKDAVKCSAFAGADWWARGLELVPEPALERWLVERLSSLLNPS